MGTGQVRDDQKWQWLERNTFACAVGRVTAQMCASLRARPRIGEIGQMKDWNQGAKHFMPSACERCHEFERLSAGVGPVEAIGASLNETPGEGTMGVKKGLNIVTRMAPDGTIEKQCMGCGEFKPQTAEYFYRDTLAGDGLVRRCKVCIAKADSERRKARNAVGHNAETDKPDPSKAAHVGGGNGRGAGLKPVTMQLPKAGGACSLVVNFSAYPDLLEKIKGIAREQVRTVEEQLIFFAMQSMLVYEQHYRGPFYVERKVVNGQE